MITPQQIKLIHIAATRAALNRQQYKLLLRNVGDVESCKQLSQASYEDCMAVLEDSGFKDTERGEHYWRGMVERRADRCSSRMAFMIHKLAADPAFTYDLGGFCLRMSIQRTADPLLLTPREAWNVIEAMKQILDREPGVIAQVAGGEASNLKEGGQGCPLPV
jgi:hypothetical protein